MSRWSRLSLRSRLTSLGVAGVALALVTGGLLLYAAMAATLDRAAVDDARAAARQVAVLVEAAGCPTPCRSRAARWCRCSTPDTGSWVRLRPRTASPLW